MATVNFSIPDDIKNRFNAVFDGVNKSAIVAELMKDAIARAEAQQRSRDAVGRISERRPSSPIVSCNEVDAAREAGRS